MLDVQLASIRASSKSEFRRFGQEHIPRPHSKSSSVPAVLILAIATTLILAACTSSNTIPDLERRTHQLNRVIMCPVCPGESIDQAQNPLAVQMRGIVAEKLGQGWSEGAIKDFFVERYGPSVLLEPPSSGFSLTVWLLPPMGVGAAMAVAIMFLRNMRRNPSPKPEVSNGLTELTVSERDRYYRRIEQALGEPQNFVAQGEFGENQENTMASQQTPHQSDS